MDQLTIEILVFSTIGVVMWIWFYFDNFYLLREKVHHVCVDERTYVKIFQGKRRITKNPTLKLMTMRPREKMEIQCGDNTYSTRIKCVGKYMEYGKKDKLVIYFD